MDIKVDGLTYDIVAEALEKCRKGRLFILDEIIKPCIAEPRAELSKYAPKMFSMQIPVDKIKDVIGKGGKVIQEMCANFNCKIDIEEDGHVFISAVDQDDAKRAISTIKTIVEDPEVGAIYKGRVTRLMNFGAFVEIAPGKEGLVHISKLDDHRVEHVEDVVAVGDVIRQVHLLPGIGGHHHLPVFLHVEDAHVAHHQIAVPGLGLLVEGLGHLRLDGVVRVQKEQVLPLGQGGPGVAGHAQALVLLVEPPHQAGVLPGVALTDFRAGVGAAVVHQDDFLLRQGLPQGGVHRPL